MAQSTAHKHDSTRRAAYQDVLDAPAHLVAEVVESRRADFACHGASGAVAGSRQARAESYGFGGLPDRPGASCSGCVRGRVPRGGPPPRLQRRPACCTQFARPVPSRVIAIAAPARARLRA